MNQGKPQDLEQTPGTRVINIPADRINRTQDGLWDQGCGLVQDPGQTQGPVQALGPRGETTVRPRAAQTPHHETPQRLSTASNLSGSRRGKSYNPSNQCPRE